MPTAPIVCNRCPKPSSVFCSMQQDPTSCRCDEACCSLAQCPPHTYRDISKCTSCDCPCQPATTTTAKPTTKVPTAPCAPCPKSKDPFCEIDEMPGCMCSKRCCSFRKCPPHTERKNCKSCDCPCQPIEPGHLKKCKPCLFGYIRPFNCNNCKCKCVPWSQLFVRVQSRCTPCPMSNNPFCKTTQNERTCECKTACCSLAPCPRGASRDIAQCSSCDCPCKRSGKPLPPMKANCMPCPRSTSPFCSPVQDRKTCVCTTKCCQMSNCPPNFERVDCRSCNCPCQPIPRIRPGRGNSGPLGYGFPIINQLAGYLLRGLSR